MRRRRLYQYGISIVIAATLFSAGAALAQDKLEPKWLPNATFDGKAGDRLIGRLGLFMPLWQDHRQLTFGDVRLRFDDDENVEGNLGLGYRTKLNNEWMLGGYGFVDVIETERDNTFWQGTVGLEALSPDWDLRANAYLPPSDKKSAPDLNTAFLSNGSIQIRGGQEAALPGMDAEVGYRLASWGDDGLGGEVRAYAGGFYYAKSGYDDVKGPRGRLELRLTDLDFLPEGSRLTLGGEITHDDVRDTEAYAVAGIRIPLNFSGTPNRARGLQGIDRRMDESVVRDWDIITQAQANGPAEQAQFLDGRPVGGVRFADGATNGDTNTVATAGMLDDAITNAGTDGVVVVLAQTGDVDVSLDQNIAPGQVVMGGGSSLPLTTAGGTNATFMAPGTRPTLTNTFLRNTIIDVGALSRILVLNDNSQLIGLDIIQTAELDADYRSIQVDGNNAIIKDVNFTINIGDIVEDYSIISVFGNNSFIYNNSFTMNYRTKLENIDVFSISGNSNSISMNNLFLNRSGVFSLFDTAGFILTGSATSNSGAGNTVSGDFDDACSNAGGVTNQLFVNGELCD